MADEYPPFRRFLLPEKEASLKLVFDNARNYVIVGAFVAMSRWLQSGKATVPIWYGTGAASPKYGLLLAGLCTAIAGVLFLLNATQSFYITTGLLAIMLRNPEKHAALFANGPVRFSLWTRIAVWCVFAALFAAAVVLMVVASNVVWYSAVGH